ncbi:DUF4166 domain-containing protein [Microbacterium sp. kSW2-24]|uniref:DUF4166 domain-containing protein n=1 Tax=Microbacterium galbinum TaxID=2851646 RepID=UPI001FFD19C1|nr:DUF4166 domain-containing protein [Microbacterium galbinum]MCK2024211.1 DUF4166 domain-containing protein [Microbacterium galbinum]
MISPYERALGDRISELHPKTAWYFRTIPDGQVGIGTGVFTRAGSPHRWLWPVFRIAESLGVAFAGWERDVPFRIENRTVGGTAVAVRYFDLPGRTWVMPDTVALGENRILRNEIGPHRTVVTTFDLDVQDGAVVLTIRRVGMRFGRVRIAAPRFLRPRIGLVERWDDGRQQHHVNMTIDAPLLGRVYEYTGYFDYVIESETP